MKKEIFAAALLIFMLVLSFVNIHGIESLAADLSGDIEKAISLAESENWPDAEKCALSSLKSFYESERYIESVLKHEKSDNLDGLYYDFIAHICDKDAAGVSLSGQRLLDFLTSLCRNEKPSLSSIF